MTIINFYCVDEDMNEFLYTFLTSLYNKNNKILIYSTNEEKMLKLDVYLWTTKQLEFLPHLLARENKAKDTPIVITNKLDNINNSNVLLITGYLDSTDFLKQFEKIIYLSPSNQDVVEKTKEVWNKYENFEKVMYRKIDNKWEKIDNLI
jgi:DNA polymerase IIIc chi subunit